MRQACRLCGTALETTFVDLGMSPPCESYLTADQLDQGGDLLPPARAGLLTSASWSSCPPTSPAEDIFSRLRLLLLLQRLLGRSTRSASSTPPRTAWAWPATRFVVEVASNDGYLLQHASRGASGRWGSSRRPTSPRRPRARGIPTEVAVPRRGDGHRGRARKHGKADLVVANNVFAHVPDIVDFAQGSAGSGGGRRAGHHRDPAPAAADRGQRVRHDLPRALLVPVAAHDPARARRGRADASSTSRSSRPTAARCGPGRCRPSRAGRAERRGRRRCWRRGGCRGSRHRRGARGLRPAVVGRAQRPAGVPDRAVRATGRRSWATARPARATRCSTTAASAAT